MKKFCLMCLLAIPVLSFAGSEKKIVKITVQPNEASIYVDNTFMGRGYAEFTRPKKNNQVAIIRCELNEYITVNSKFYGGDKRSSLAFTMQQDGFYRASAASGLVNKFMTVMIDEQYYSIEDGKIDVSRAWKLLHQIILNYYDEIGNTDADGGYLQTPWQYKSFNLTDKQIRTRVTVRDISTPSRVAFQIKVSSEVAGASAAKHGEFTEVDRIPKEMEPLLEELQTRIGKVNSY